MTLPAYTRFPIQKGMAEVRWFRAIYKGTSTVVDFAAIGLSKARLTVRPLLAGEVYGAPVLTLTSDAGDIVLGVVSDGDAVTPRNWSGYVYIGATKTENLTPWGLGGFSLEVYNPSIPDEVLIILTGPCWLQTDATP